MNRAQVGLVALVLFGAGVAVAALTGHDAALDRDRALLVAQTERFGPGTRGRIAAWAEATRPGQTLRWSADDPPLFADVVPVTVHIGDDRPYRFEVVLGERVVRPLDDETRGLVQRIERWAAGPTGEGGPRPPK